MGRRNQHFPYVTSQKPTMNKIYLFLVITLTFSSYAQKEADLNSKGIEYAKKGNFKKAFELFTEAIEANPQYAPAYSNRGQVYREQGQNELAVRDFTQSLELKADDPYILHTRATVYMDMNLFEKAASDYSAVIKKDPSFPDIYFDRSYSYIRQQKYQEAKADLEQQLILYPKDFKSLANLINLKKKLNLLQDALADYDTLLKEFPNEPDMHIVYNNRANLHQEMNHLDKALEDINKALLIKADYDMGYLNRAEIYDKMGNKEKACVDFNKALQLKVESNPHFEADADYLSVKKLCN